jgi:hypothetical protein
MSKAKQQYDDLTAEEVKDIEEFYASKDDHKTRTLKKLLDELNSVHKSAYGKD